MPPCDELALDAPPPQANLVLVVNDTMRRDPLGAYGGPAATPVFDAFAREHLLFERATSEAPWTRPAIATLFTSHYPSQHGLAGVRPLSAPGAPRGLPGKRLDVLGASFVTLAEVLQAAGFRTAAFSANMWFDRAFGFDQGFGVYDGEPATWGIPGAELNRKALAWLAGREPGERFFLYVHYMDSHEPYGPLGPADLEDTTGSSPQANGLSAGSALLVGKLLRLEDGRSLAEANVRPSRRLVVRAYQRGIEAFDRALGELLAALRQREDWARTAVVVTSDHGEALYERGYGGHGNALLESETAVPLAARLPGLRAARPRVQCAVGLIDLLPTLCGYLGVRCPSGLQGTSLLPDGEAGRARAPRFLVSEGVRGHPTHRAVRDARFKLIYEPDGRVGPDGARSRASDGDYALFDLVADPQERVDLLRAEAPPGESLVAGLVEALESAVPETLPPVRRFEEISSDTLEHLQALGYLDPEPAPPGGAAEPDAPSHDPDR